MAFAKLDDRLCARSMPIAPHFNDPEYWHKRAEEARVLAERMSNERTKKMMLNQLAVRAAIRSIDETKGS